MQRIIFGFLLLCLFTTQAHAQRYVQGYVVDADLKEGIFAAHVIVADSDNGTVTDSTGYFWLEVPYWRDTLIIRYPFHATERVAVQEDTMLIELSYSGGLDTVATFDPETYEENYSIVRRDYVLSGKRPMPPPNVSTNPSHNTEDYTPIVENGEQQTWESPLSTFSIDVDRASYSNVRRYLRQGQRPPEDAVRIEELINYFDYDYAGPGDEGEPFSLHAELSECPWNKERHLLHLALQGRRLDRSQLPPSNLVFLMDVSGSMQQQNKLSLAKQAMRLLVEELRPADRVAIVVYAGAAGVVLPPTPGSQPQKIREAINSMEAGGSTAGGEGIKLAYQLAREHFLPRGNNRVILATDGDFNVGVSSDGGLTRLIEQERESGVFLSVLGFGQGNYKDNKMELLADKGNGNYAYIDGLAEAKKVLVEELPGTLFTIAKDVKLQLEFNPGVVQSYRLVGYENRLLDNEDFNNDAKDAGELGAGHTVTALYELQLKPKQAKDTGLRYQSTSLSRKGRKGKELGFLELRYKDPANEKSCLLSFALDNAPEALAATSNDFRFATAVAGFGMKLRGSSYNRSLDWPDIHALAKGALGADQQGHKTAFLELVKVAEGL